MGYVAISPPAPKDPNKTCDVCGLFEDESPHKDVADCMVKLMDYIVPEVRCTSDFKRAVEAGYKAMKEELKK